MSQIFVHYVTFNVHNSKQLIAVAESLQDFKSKRTSQQIYSSHCYMIISSVGLLKA